MLSEGPLNINLMETEEGSREIHIDFADDFKILTTPEQINELNKVINHLRTKINLLKEDNPDRLGMSMILQIAEEIVPHVEANDISFDETIVGTIKDNNPFSKLLAQASSTLKN